MKTEVEQKQQKKQTRFTELQALLIHHGLHSNHVGETITVDKTNHYTIYKSTNGCKAVNVEGYVFMEQNRMKSGRWADMANQGVRVTWIIPSDNSSWGRIVGDKVEILI